ncbi:hypothetical protein chiPu_0031740, partial [Chiloscyllium punctatum]|nr:hypothetical protein [Chiloscyllium punctatum]
AEQVALDLIEIHLVRGEKIRARLDPLGDGLRAGIVGELDDAPAHRLLQALIGAAGDVLMIDLELDERKVRQSQQGRPVGADIVDRDADIVQANAPCDLDRKVEIVDHLGAVDLDQQAGESRMVRNPVAELAHRMVVREKRDRQIDREIDRPDLFDEIAPVLDRALDHELGQCMKMRIAFVGDEVGRRHDAPCGMAHPDQCLGSAWNQRPE